MKLFSRVPIVGNEGKSLGERGGQFAKRMKQVKQGPQVKPNRLSLPQGTSESFLYAHVPNNIFSMSAEKAEEAMFHHLC